MNKWQVYRSVGLRPVSATRMLWRHRRTLAYLWKQKRYTNFWNHIFVTYFVRGEDCGKGVFDPLWKFTGWAPFLWDLELEITTSCYLRCVFCENRFFPKEYRNQNLKFADFKKLIDRIPHLRWINLTGEGSAFLNPDFLDIVKYCKEKGLYVDFSHDFWRLSEEAMRHLVEWGVDRIYWSFDGVTKETYEKVRVGAKFEETCENVKRLVALKKEMGSPLPEICFRFCFFKDNVDEVKLIPSFLFDLVEGHVGLYGDEPSINIVALLEFEQTKDWACEIPCEVVDLTDISSKVLDFTNYWSHVTHIEENKSPMDYCTFWSEPYIMITGHVVPCCATLMSNKRPELERLSFGNIYEQSFRDIWYSDKYKRFRRMVVNPKAPVPEVCLGCRSFNTQDRARRCGVEKVS